MWLDSLWVKDKTEWHFGGPAFWQRGVRAITGEELRYPSLQRRIKGEWQYRNATADEDEDHKNMAAW